MNKGFEFQAFILGGKAGHEVNLWFFVLKSFNRLLKDSNLLKRNSIVQ